VAADGSEHEAADAGSAALADDCEGYSTQRLASEAVGALPDDAERREPEDRFELIRCFDFWINQVDYDRHGDGEDERHEQRDRRVCNDRMQR